MYTVYKACRKYGEGYHSYNPPNDCSEYNLAYGLGMKTEAVEGTLGLCVFPELEDAAGFCSWGMGYPAIFSGGAAILECATEHVPTQQGWLIRATMDKHWACPHRASGKALRLAPWGTFTVPSLTPIREVTWEEWKAGQDQSGPSSSTV